MNHRSWSLLLAVIFGFAGLVGPKWSHADDAANATKIVKEASDAELRAEFQRRFEARNRVRNRPEASTRMPQSPLSTLDDARLLDTVRQGGRTRAIYGTDDRKDWYDIKDPRVKALAQASVAVVRAADVMKGEGGKARLAARPLREVQKLCPGETFAEQPVAAFCSGTLVRPDVVLTAGHCVREISNRPNVPYVDSVSFVFGFRMEKRDADAVTVPADQIFAGKEAIAGELSETTIGNQKIQRDWALVRLDKPVPSALAEPVATWRSEPVKKGEKVFVIGYPSGLPLKYAPGARVLRDDNPTSFIADLDTFGGNSGSGVYDMANNVLIGVLVRGDTDYVRHPTNTCAITNLCPANGCEGEGVTRISIVKAP